MNIKIKISTENIVKATSGILIGGDMGIHFKGISTDTRIIKPGYLFWALKGEKFDGHDFYKEAIEKGAKGIVISRFPREFKMEEIPKTISVILVKDTLRALGDLANFWRRKLNCIIVAITGSCGKTTTKEMSYNILSRFFKTAKNQANYNNLIGVPLSLLSIGENAEVGILELGTNQKGEIERLSQIVEPQISVITSVYPSHLDGLDSLEGVLEEKITLFKNTHRNGTIIYNFDQQILREKAQKFSQNKISFGLNPEADLSFQNLVLSEEKIKGEIKFKNNSYLLEIENIGKHNLLNLLASLCVAISLKLELKNIIPLIGNEIPLFKRFKVFEKKNFLIIDDTYNANPGSTKAALEFIKGLSKNWERKVVILGDMKELGKDSKMLHEEIGKLVAEVADFAIFTGEMAKSYEKGFRSEKNKECKTFDSVDELLKNFSLKEFLEKEKRNTAILIKGSRALRMERIVEKLIEELS
ncbi:MAG: UDP-N-acetylmuramoyl-tripeptide--D-alanyl-D-alanine ligase [Thermodesulfobacterium sp.]|nr:UDP-N-acetylmuramoyl-tripeptide--D-alanyl-D-alanine ligase [Thermodesulfobacterium sp.]